MLLQEAASHPLCRRLELKDLIPTAMQRLTKYPLLIESLLKYTQCKLLHAVFTKLYIYIYIYVYIYILFIYVCIYVCMRACVCVCVCVIYNI